jgi:NodT family efflux transporter outer membrane factor (OMF) lipoprotein
MSKPKNDWFGLLFLCFKVIGNSCFAKVGAELLICVGNQLGCLKRIQQCAGMQGYIRGILLVTVISSILIAGCAIKRGHYDVPVVLLSDKYQQAELFPEAEDKTSQSVGVTLPTKPVQEVNLDEWWRSLGSAELNALIDQALANNTDLRIATLRLAQSQARSNQAEAGQFPTLTGPLEVHQDAPANGVNSATSSSSSDPKHREYYQGSLRGDWRVDLWGELRSMAESAEMQLWQATYRNDDVHRTLVASVVSQYIEFLSLNDRLRVARETEIALHDMLKAVSDRVDVGDATIIDLEQQRSADFAIHATIPGLELQREMAAHALALLLGVTPSAFTLSDQGLDSLTFPGAPHEVPPSLLLRRPDIRAVEARLLAADADIDVARARLFPPLNLNSQGSYGLLAYGQLFGPYGLIYSAVGNLTTTIFDHGKRTQDVDFARAMHEELVETYLHTVYLAVRETEDALASTYMNGRRLAAQKVSAEAALRAWSASKESYEVGGVDFLTLMDTQRTYHRILDEYHHIRQEHFNGLVSLYSALGGGVRQGGALPGDGVRPQGDLAKASASPVSSALAMPGIDWTGRNIDTDNEFWLVELAGLQDRAGVTHAWRDLHQRFPNLMAGRIALPRLQGKVAKEQQERATWYRMFIAHFPSQDEADSFCGQLSVKQVRCNVVSSDAGEFSNFIEDDLADPVMHAAIDSSVKPAPSPELQGSLVEESKRPVRTDPYISSNTEEARSSLSSMQVSAVDSKNTSVEPAPVMIADSKKEGAAASVESKSSQSGYAVQVETVYDREDAEKASAVWSRKGYKTYIQQVRVRDGKVVFALRTGFYSSRKEASVQADALHKDKRVDAIPVLVNLEDTAIEDDSAHKVAEDMSQSKRPDLDPVPFGHAQERLVEGTAQTDPDKSIDKVEEAPSSVVPVQASDTDSKNVSVELATDSKKEIETGEGVAQAELKSPQLGYSVQVETVYDREDAEKASAVWSRKGYNTYIQQVQVRDGKVAFALRTGFYSSRKEASVQADALHKGKRVDAMPVLINLEEAGNLLRENRPASIRN